MWSYFFSRKLWRYSTPVHTSKFFTFGLSNIFLPKLTPLELPSARKLATLTYTERKETGHALFRASVLASILLQVSRLVNLAAEVRESICRAIVGVCISIQYLRHLPDFKAEIFPATEDIIRSLKWVPDPWTLCFIMSWLQMNYYGASRAAVRYCTKLFRFSCTPTGIIGYKRVELLTHLRGCAMNSRS